MKKAIVVLILFALNVACGEQVKSGWLGGKLKHLPTLFPETDGDAGEPLFLSKYLPNNAAEARKLSAVQGLWKFPSYSGFFTVDNSTGSNMFFWFFPAQSGDSSAPLLIWLQGGPGGSSLFGLFGENGPFSVAADGKTLVPRKATWNLHYHMLYIDNPVGTGFSFTTDAKGFATNEDEVAENLYSVLQQFYEVFPDYKANDLYITGESYAGKYIPSISFKIHQMNKNSSVEKISLKGLAIGDGAMDPITQFTGYSDLMYYLSFCDERERERIKLYESQIIEKIGEQDLVGAFRVFDEMLNGDFYPYPTYYYNITGITNYFNFLDPPYPPNPFGQYLNQASVRASIHVGDVPYADGNSTVEYHLLADWMRSVAPKVAVLLDNYKVMIYNGQLDMILGPPLTEDFLRTLEWGGTEEYRHAKKTIWKMGGEVVGYARSVRKLRQVVVRSAGHLLPADQPDVALDMITRFVENRHF